VRADGRPALAFRLEGSLYAATDVSAAAAGERLHGRQEVARSPSTRLGRLLPVNLPRL